MKNKHIHDYFEYIKIIESLSNKEDFNIYNNIINDPTLENLLINEGLIKTHPIQKSIDIIKKRFPNLNVKMEKDEEIKVKGDMSKLEKYIPLFTNLGYFISAYINEDNTGDIIVNVYDTDTTGIILEPKYDIEIYPIPKILYHASMIRFKDKINRNGFVPKSGNKESIHPERIYLTDDLKIAIGFGENLKSIKIVDKDKKDRNTGFCIYEIKGSGIEKLYSDINLRNVGFYTDQNIAPEYCKLIMEHKWENIK